jgi:hypothetical protein
MTTPHTTDARIPSTKIERGDPRYRAVVDKRFNKRFNASPDYVRLVDSTEQVRVAVEEAVSEGRRVVVTSGGHCLEGFVSDPDVRVIVDVSPMKRIYYDADKRAIAVEAGVTVGEAFRALFETWGAVIPLGEYPGIGMGGHVVGGAFGFLCRQLGLAADYLYAVYVVTVNESGRACSVVARRETNDPNRDLWWAHTGAGGGNYGVVTRYWFRSPGAAGEDPATLLPRAPDSITTFRVEWDWNRIDRTSFLRLLGNHGVWHERNAGADSPHASLWTLLEIHRKQFGKIIFRGVSTAGDAAERQIDECLMACSDGVPPLSGRELSRMSWLEFALNPFPDLFGMPPDGVSVKAKDAMLKKRFTDRQAGVAYDHLTSADHDVMGGMLGLASYGASTPWRRTRLHRRSAVRSSTPPARRDGWIHATKRRTWPGFARSIATCSRRPAAFPFPATRTMARLSTTRTPTSLTRRGTRPACRGPRCITRTTTRACSGSRRSGTRGTCSDMRCPFV